MNDRYIELGMPKEHFIGLSNLLQSILWEVADLPFPETDMSLVEAKFSAEFQLQPDQFVAVREHARNQIGRDRIELQRLTGVTSE
jgi:hypothetical protein